MFYRKINWNMETLEVTLRIPSSYSGPADLLCGATGGQKRAAAKQEKILDTLSSDAQFIFSTNKNLLDSALSSVVPVVTAGPDQYGFGAAEDSAMRTQATDQISAANRNATNALRSSLVSEGGGHAVLPSGSSAALEGELAELEAQKQSAAQLGITEKGYETGRENYFKSVAELGALPGQLENPATSAGSAASGASGENISAQNDIAQAQNAWVAPVAGMLGAVGGAALGKPGK